MVGPDVIVTHSEENLATSEMGMIAAVPAASKGTLTDKDARWIVRDVQAGYGSPVSDGERIYLVDNGGVLFAFDVEDRQAALDREPRHDPEVLAGARRRQAVCRHGERQVLHHPAARRQGRGARQRSARHRKAAPRPSSRRRPSRAGRVYVVTMDGNVRARAERRAGCGAAQAGSSGSGGAGRQRPVTPAALLVTPTDLILKPGEAVALTMRAFDANGRSVTAPAQATWTVEGLKGTIENGRFTPDPAAGAQAGMVKATAGALSGTSRIRVVPPLPWTFDFEDGRETPPALLGQRHRQVRGA